MTQVDDSDTQFLVKSEESKYIFVDSEKQRQEISQKLKETINLATTAAREGRCVKVSGEYIAQDVKSELFDQLAEAFPSVKMEYDHGRIKIIEVQGCGHQAVIHKIGAQLDRFYDRPLLRNTFGGGGGLTPTYTYENGLYKKTGKKADPDEALKVFRNRKWVIRVIFEVEIHNRNFAELNDRMTSLLGGWPDCLIGIAVKYFPRKVDNGDFEGVLLIYYKRNGLVALKELRDVGTTQLSESHLESMREISENVEMEIPAPEERCKIVRSNNDGKVDTLETSNPEFYRITLDSDLLYQSTEFAGMEGERPTLTLDFLKVTQQLHREEGKTFAGALPVDTN